MTLLPNNASEFVQPEYWKSFFDKRQTPFEWYGAYEQIGESLEKYMKPGDNVLQIGCGNSLLAEQLHDNGYKQIVSIDTDSGVIGKQKIRNKNKRPRLVFQIGDATKLDFETEQFSIVLDKGTLDALYPINPNDSSSVDCDLLQRVCDMLEEVNRVLAPSGRYLVISLAQRHILEVWANFFAKTLKFMIRVHQLEKSGDDSPMPVFLLIATKLRLPMKKCVIEFHRRDTSKADRVENVDGLLELVAAAQEYEWFCHLCSRKLEKEISIRVNEAGSGLPRYIISICDDPSITSVCTYAVFIVPIGRECEWCFSTAKGRQNLRRMTSKDRLAIVRLCRDQSYGCLEDVKIELSSTAQHFAPTAFTGKQIELLSLEKVDVREGGRCLASDTSEINGQWTVEDVSVQDTLYRRLVFLASQNLVQSEALLIKKNGGKLTVNRNKLTCGHHEAMLSAFGLLDPQPPASLCSQALSA